MNYQVIKTKSLNVCGVSVLLTTSQSQNAVIIGNHWKRFNSELKARKIKLGKNWIKYGITKKIKGEYYYIPAIPACASCDDLELVVINEGDYACFTHQGSMALMKKNYNEIYKNIIPKADFNIDSHREMIHYEYYDFRFNWNNPDSIIDIYVPISFNKFQ